MSSCQQPFLWRSVVSLLFSCIPLCLLLFLCSCVHLLISVHLITKFSSRTAEYYSLWLQRDSGVVVVPLPCRPCVLSLKSSAWKRQLKWSWSISTGCSRASFCVLAVQWSSRNQRRREVRHLQMLPSELHPLDGCFAVCFFLRGHLQMLFRTVLLCPCLCVWLLFVVHVCMKC